MSVSRLVVDASVGVKIFVQEDLSVAAQRLFALAIEDDYFQLHVPDLFYAECANVLWKNARYQRLSRGEVLSDLKDLTTIPLHVTSTRGLIETALAAALRFDIAAYDACYVALAEQLNAPLVTMDQEMTRRLKGSKYLIRLLDETSDLREYFHV